MPTFGGIKMVRTMSHFKYESYAFQYHTKDFSMYFQKTHSRQQVQWCNAGSKHANRKIFSQLKTLCGFQLDLSYK